MKRTAFAAALSLALAVPAIAAETRCGWLENPTPANWWLDDAENTWTIMTQGADDEPQGMDLIPSNIDFAGAEMQLINEVAREQVLARALTPFIEAGKAVFHVEYTGSTAAFCPDSRRLKLSSMLKKPELGVWREPC